MRIDSSGNVGIGTTSPACGLHIDNPNNAAITQILDTDNSAVKLVFRNNTETGNNMQIGADGSNLVALTGATERMRIDSSGNVGIGTTSPSSNLHIASSLATIRLEDSDVANGASYSLITSSSNGNIELSADPDGNRSSTDIRFNIDGSELMRLDTNGRVGIGTTSPATLLNINVDTEANLGSGSEGIRLTSGSSNAQLVRLGNSYSNGTVTGPGTLLYSSNKLSIRADNGNPITFHNGSTLAERMRVDSNGDVAIGTSSAGGNRLLVQLTDDNSDHFKVVGGSGQGRTNITVQMGNTDSTASTAFRIANSSGNTIASFFVANNADDLNITNQSSGGQIRFNTSSTSNSLGSLTRARFDMDGNLFGGKSSSDINNTGFEFKQNGLNGFTRNNGGVLAVNRGTNNGTLISLRRSNSEGGTIGITPSSASFNTSSDYRLKENLQAISDGITRLKTLKPYRFNFKIDATTTVDGFLAHEVTAVPEAITGTKDQVVTQAMIDSGEYEEGTLNDPIYQSIDQSKLVPLLVAALQEEISKREALEARVAALEAA
jgi:hypothetical protein